MSERISCPKERRGECPIADELEAIPHQSQDSPWRNWALVFLGSIIMAYAGINESRWNAANQALLNKPTKSDLTEHFAQDDRRLADIVLSLQKQDSESLRAVAMVEARAHELEGRVSATDIRTAATDARSAESLAAIRVRLDDVVRALGELKQDLNRGGRN